MNDGHVLMVLCVFASYKLNTHTLKEWLEARHMPISSLFYSAVHTQQQPPLLRFHGTQPEQRKTLASSIWRLRSNFLPLNSAVRVWEENACHFLFFFFFKENDTTVMSRCENPSTAMFCIGKGDGKILSPLRRVY